MILKDIHFHQFKNSDSLQYFPEVGMNFIIGENGLGKTNILDAIHFCCMTKSYFHHSEKLCIQHEKDFFRLESHWIDSENESHEVVVKCTRESGREIRWDQKDYNKASEHLGKIPVIMIIPDEVYTFVSHTEERRKFLNYTLIQIDKEYFAHLNKFNQQLKQRTALLKSYNISDAATSKLLDVYESDMANSANYICNVRNQFIQTINPLLQKYSLEISKGLQSCQIVYSSNASTDELISIWRNERATDYKSGRTRTGIHRDRLECLFNNQSLQSFGSQGQIKTFVIALRLAQMKFLEEYLKSQPVLLLDDLFAKLDEERVSQLLQIIEQSGIRQCFVTDTNMDRAKKISQELKIPCTLHLLKNNHLSVYEKK
ncbi:MAG: DNA replication and repair protein RecF [Saprospiraceae bacterium]|nr:DNA replication and repair protein RecF [Saprospiraceae bacterium]